MKREEFFVAAYTTEGKREATDKSMHLAIGGKEGFTPLNYGMGILYAEADKNPPDFNAKGTYRTRTMETPWLFRMKDGKIGVLAAESGEDLRGGLFFWTTKDFITYKYEGLIRLHHEKMVKLPQCRYDESGDEYIITCSNGKGGRYACKTTDFVTIREPCLLEESAMEPFYTTGIPGAVSCVFAVTEKEAEKLKAKMGQFENTGVEEIRIRAEAGKPPVFEELPGLTALYSDGSRAVIPVEWKESDYKKADFNTPGCCEIRGRAVVKEYAFPMMEGRADPDILYYNKKYYFIATNDAGQNNFFMRCAHTIEGLAAAEDVLILAPAEKGDMSGCNWAPELHVINGELWMLFASGTTGSWDSVQCRMMKCNGNPLKAEDWGKPVRVLKKDGSYLCGTGITLDMTYFENGGEHYLVWAQRDVAVLSGRPYNDSSNIMIGKISAEKPWQLINDPVEICHPRYGWDRCTTEVDEGPFIIKHGNKIFITFSGSGVDVTYILGLLAANKDADLCDVNSWTETGYPILASEHVEDQLGPGHNSFTVDEYGRDVIVFHAKSSEKSIRHATARTVHWAADGTPILFMTGERELKKEYREVTAFIEVTATIM